MSPITQYEKSTPNNIYSQAVSYLHTLMETAVKAFYQTFLVGHQVYHQKAILFTKTHLPSPTGWTNSIHRVKEGGSKASNASLEMRKRGESYTSLRPMLSLTTRRAKARDLFGARELPVPWICLLLLPLLSDGEVAPTWGKGERRGTPLANPWTFSLPQLLPFY